ncbi:MAG: hypothetical protein A2068_12890 [Ignavibacteria bacterium GWB2_35_6b]|nr:MAG: hypothetical protein A2068_12890 [Ignavibacteria bacterium GWB2_35_6b]
MKTNSVITLILISLFVFVNQVKAQETKEETEELNTYNFYFINGYAISFDFYKHENSAMRLQLDFNGTDLSNESSGNRYGTNNSDEKITEEIKSSSFSISVSPQYMYTFFKSINGDAYFSLGPFLSFNSENREQINTYKLYDIFNGNSESENRFTNNNKIWNLGLTAVVGLKGRITENISLFAESHFSASKRWNSNEDISSGTEYYYNSKTTKDGDGWEFTTNFVRVGVSISL